MAGTVIDKPMDHRATEQAVLDRAGTTRMTEAEQVALYQLAMRGEDGKLGTYRHWRARAS
jgi:hypothetical protein